MAAHDHSEPSLQLEDIIHSMSPEPNPPGALSRPETASPEPLTEADVLHMRRRIAEMGLEGKGKRNASSREDELVDMVRSGMCAVRRC